MFQGHYNSQLDKFKESFLTEAARCGRTEEVASLLDLGARVDWSPDDKDTPLLAAVKNNHIDVATILIANGADIQRKSEGGNTALHLASMRGNEEMCALLLSATSGFESNGTGNDQGCKSLNVVNEEGMTPFDIAVEMGHWALGQTLKNISDTAIDDLGSMYCSSDEDDDDSIRDRFLAHGYLNQDINTRGPSLMEDSIQENYEEDDKAQVSSWQHESNGNESIEETYKKDNINHLNLERLMEENAQLREAQDSSSQTCKEAEKAILILEQRCKELEKENRDFLKSINKAVKSDLFSRMSIEEIEVMEEQLRLALDGIVNTKMTKLSQQAENRTCVICQVEPKTVLLMPCRHLCVCKDCSRNDKLLSCPLCRKKISEKIDVYS